MAQYFTPPRQQSSSREQAHDQRQLHANEAFKLKLAALDESAVYIFPNPSSAPATSIPPSPSQASDFSVPTELTLSGIGTEWSSPSQPPLDTPRYLLSSRFSTPAWESQLVFPEPEDGGLLTPQSVLESGSWPASPVARHLMPEDEDEADEETGASASNNNDDGSWLARLLPHFIRNLTSPSTSPAVDIAVDEPPQTICAPDSAKSHTQRHDLPLPLLSFILSLFSIDESTAELLKSDKAPTHSELFPGRCLYDDEKAALKELLTDDETSDSDGELHGLERLLVEEKFNSHYAVRRAFWHMRRDSDEFSTSSESSSSSSLDSASF